MSDAGAQPAHKTLLLLTVDTEASMAGLRPLPPEAMVYGRFDGGTYGIERIMDCCEARGFKATFFVSALEALHYGDGHVRRMAAAALGRGHDVQLHTHPVWLPAANGRKAMVDYTYEEQLAAIGQAADILRRTSGVEPLVHRSGGLWLNADTLRALRSLGIRYDASVAVGAHEYRLGGGQAAANVPRRLGEAAEVPVTTFAQVRLGRWAPRRLFDLNADSLSELTFVVDRAAEEGVAAIALLMHSFSFVARSPDRTEFGPAEGELRKFERLLDHVSRHPGVEVVTFRELARRVEAEPTLLDGPDFEPTAGLMRTYGRSWERFGTGWKSKAFALGLPALLAALAAAVIGAIWWLTS